MTKLESLKKLRKAAEKGIAELPEQNWSCSLLRPESEWLKQIHDEILAEIDERYMLLPVDADGVPIHIGDKVIDLYRDDWFYVGSIEGKNSVRIDALDDGLVLVDCENLRHVKPDPIKQLLRDYCVDIAHQLEADPDKTISESTIADYAERIRQAVES